MTSPIVWQKSSFSQEHGDCVELAAADGRIRLRESDDPGVVVSTSQYRLKALILAVKAGEFDDLG